MEYWIDLKQLTVLVLTLVLYVGKSDEWPEYKVQRELYAFDVKAA
jgi:hypothetical protein